LVNGVAAHVLDYDDVSLDGHPSAVHLNSLLSVKPSNGMTGNGTRPSFCFDFIQYRGKNQPGGFVSSVL
jgi:hypothetical protein